MMLEQQVLQDLQQLLAAVPTDVQRGLANDRIMQLRDQYGANVIKTSQHSWLNLLMRQFNSGFVYLLLVVVGVYFLLGEWTNSLIMLAIIALMATFGFYEEFFADRTLQDLRAHLRFHVRVIRGGHETMIDAEDLVVGDLVLVEPGDAICADMRIIHAEGLQLDESGMTGESIPVVKKECVSSFTVAEAAMYMLYAGTKVVSGKGSGIVVATGMQTAFGKLVGISLKPARPSNFSQGLNKFSLFVFCFVSVTISIIFLTHLLLRGTSIDIFRLMIFYISLAVAVVPQALQVVVNFALARAAAQLAKRKVLVKRFAALEDLASVEVLCVDKTGTLTENHLRIVEAKTVEGWHSDDVLIAAYQGIAVRQKKSIEPFDCALVEEIHDRGFAKESTNVLEQIPFDPIHKRNITFVAWEAHVRTVVRGAFEEVISCCRQQDHAKIDVFKAWIEEQEALGRRVLTIAIGVDVKPNDSVMQDLQLVGAIAFQDSIKKSALAAINQAHSMNVEVKMLTGDSPIVARQVAQELKIFAKSNEIITGSMYDILTDEEKNNALVRCNVFARVSPLQKYDIIMRLKQRYDIGFLGEGINDVPSIRAANVGFAVSNAVDAARDAADIVLLTKSINVIIEGICQGRAVFVNSVKYLRFTLSSNFSNFYTLAIISLMNGKLPMLPIQLLVVNLISDLPMLFIATDHVEADELEYPTSANVKGLIVMTTFFGVVCTVFDFLFLHRFYYEAPALLQTNWFVFSLWTELALFFPIRTKKFLWQATRPSWQLVLALIFVGGLGTILPFTTIGQKFLHLCPLEVSHFGYMVVVLVLNVIVVEFVKALWYRSYAPK